MACCLQAARVLPAINSIAILAGQSEKILVLEIGGNNALIVNDSEDLDAAVNLAI